MRVKTTEASVLKGCLEFLALHKVFAWRSGNSGTRRRDSKGREFWTFAGLKGAADIMGILSPNGRMLGVECKSATGQLTNEQFAFIQTVNQLGGLAFMVRSVGDLETRLKQEGVIP